MTTAIRPGEIELVVFAVMQYSVEPSADSMISSGWAEQHRYGARRVRDAYERLANWGLIRLHSKYDRADGRFQSMRHLAMNPEQVDAIPYWFYPDPYGLRRDWDIHGVLLRPSSIELILFAAMQHWNRHYLSDADTFGDDFGFDVNEVGRANDNLVAYGLVMPTGIRYAANERPRRAEWVVNGFEFVMPKKLPWWGQQLTRTTLAEVAK